MPTATRSLAEVVLHRNIFVHCNNSEPVHRVLAGQMTKFLLKRANLGEGGVYELVIRNPTGKVGGIEFGRCR